MKFLPGEKFPLGSPDPGGSGCISKISLPQKKYRFHIPGPKDYKMELTRTLKRVAFCNFQVVSMGAQTKKSMLDWSSTVRTELARDITMAASTSERSTRFSPHLGQFCLLISSM